MKMLFFSTIATFGILFGPFHDTAQAATCSARTNVNDAGQVVNYEAFQTAPGTISNITCIDFANDSEVIDENFEIFGQTGWLFSEIQDGQPDDANPQLGPIGFFPGDVPGDRSVLAWFVVGDLSNVESAFISFNQSLNDGEKSFAAFELDLSNLDKSQPLLDPGTPLNGTLTTNVFRSDNCFDFTGAPQNQCVEIASASLYYKPVDSMTPIPLPAAGWMLLAGLGAMAAMRRQRPII